jgi:hypothetical protein
MRSPSLLAALLLMAHVPVAWAQRPADALLRLVPPEAGATLAVEDLRTHAPRFLASPVVTDLKTLPAVRDWMASSAFHHFNQTCGDLEKALQRPRATIRDQLLGEAVVLAFHLDPS